MSTLFKIVIALAAANAVTAAPNPVWQWEGTGPNTPLAGSSSISSISMSMTSSVTTKPSAPPAPPGKDISTSSVAAAAPAAPTPPTAAQAAAAAKALAIKQVAESLRTKVTAVDRAKVLFAQDPTAATAVLKTGTDLVQNLVFDFNPATPGAGEFGGRKMAASVDTFPFLTNSGLSTTVAFLGPCGMNTPHVHPRGNEFLTVVNGQVSFGMILENGFTSELAGTLNAFQATLFPEGSIHYQFNPTCQEATFVATLSSEDPGTNQVAQGFFGLNGEVVKAATGFQVPVAGARIEEFRSHIPVSLAQGIEQCLNTCKIAKKATP